MKLHYSRQGTGKVLVILHGLYGSGNNWMSIARSLSSKYTVILVDQRNHGLSEHSSTHNYDEMANDLRELCTELNLNSFFLLGHSMGGKTAITFVLKFPGLTEKLIVVDISPYSYLEQEYFRNQIRIHKTILELFKNTPLQSVKSRAEVENYFDREITDIETRKFLLKNLKRRKDGTFYWQLNTEALISNFESIVDSAPPVKLGARSNIPVLFFRGEKSEYLPSEEMDAITDVFPHARFETFKNSGHWLHFEHPDLFVEKVSGFLL